MYKVLAWDPIAEPVENKNEATLDGAAMALNSLRATHKCVCLIHNDVEITRYMKYEPDPSDVFEIVSRNSNAQVIDHVEVDSYDDALTRFNSQMADLVEGTVCLYVGKTTLAFDTKIPG